MRTKSSKGGKTTTDAERKAIIEWLSDPINFQWITGPIFKGAVFLGPNKERTGPYSKLADHVNKNCGTSWNSHSARSRYLSYLGTYRFAQKRSLEPEFQVVTEKDVERGLFTLDHKLEHICPFYKEMHALYKDSPPSGIELAHKSRKITDASESNLASEAQKRYFHPDTPSADGTPVPASTKKRRLKSGRSKSLSSKNDATTDIPVNKGNGHVLSVASYSTFTPPPIRIPASSANVDHELTEEQHQGSITPILVESLLSLANSGPRRMSSPPQVQSTQYTNLYQWPPASSPEDSNTVANSTLDRTLPPVVLSPPRSRHISPEGKVVHLPPLSSVLYERQDQPLSQPVSVSTSPTGSEVSIEVVRNGYEHHHPQYHPAHQMHYHYDSSQGKPINLNGDLKKHHMRLPSRPQFLPTPPPYQGQQYSPPRMLGRPYDPSHSPMSTSSEPRPAYEYQMHHKRPTLLPQRGQLGPEQYHEYLQQGHVYHEGLDSHVPRPGPPGHFPSPHEPHMQHDESEYVPHRRRLDDERMLNSR